ncbi:MAG: hypothetical protein PHQ86_07560, partial [Dehalococcoidales bacterium]|nr:hypothetical protein [Dehalococcoidales bacterium]
MKNIISMLLIISLFASGCACQPSATENPPIVNQEYADKLAAKYSPLIYLKGEGTAIENYNPAPVEIMVDQAFMRDIKDPSFNEKATLPGLLQWSGSIYYLDILGLVPAAQSAEEYQSNYEKIKGLYQNTIYVRV